MRPLKSEAIRRNRPMPPARKPNPAGSISGMQGLLSAIALGSSMGDRHRALALALKALDSTAGLEVLAVSRLYRTSPMGHTARGWFLNAVALLDCSLCGKDLLERCKEIERRLGRKPAPRWADRPVDLDILLMGNMVSDDPDLTLPHPHMGRRDFVLTPLLEIAPEARNPRNGLRWAAQQPRDLPLPIPVGILAARSPTRYDGQLHEHAAPKLGGGPDTRPSPSITKRNKKMKLFIDTANLDEIREASSWGIIDGCTTNPSLIAREGGDFIATIHQICQIVSGPVSAEVIAQDSESMVREGRLLARIDPNIVVKVPLTTEGLKASRQLSGEGIRVNVTLCFQPSQALLAAKVGATYVSPFVGRLDDINQDGMELIRQIVHMLDNYPDYDTQVLVASVRHPQHVVEAALAGADVATVPFKVLAQLVEHPLTEAGNKRFLADWAGVADRDIVAQVERWLARNS